MWIQVCRSDPTVPDWNIPDARAPSTPTRLWRIRMSDMSMSMSIGELGRMAL